LEEQLCVPAKRVFVAAVLLMNLISASLGMGLTIPTSESLATFLPSAPRGWEADPRSSTVFDQPNTGSFVYQAYTGPSGRTVNVTIQAFIKSPTQTEDQPEDQEGPQCRSDSKEYDIQGFRVYDMTLQCPDYSGHFLETALRDSKDFFFSVSVSEDGAAKDDGTLRAILESMDLKGLRNLAG